MSCVKGLKVQQAILRRAEQRYGLSIHRILHSDLMSLVNNQTLQWFRSNKSPLKFTSPRQSDDSFAGTQASYVSLRAKRKLTAPAV